MTIRLGLVGTGTVGGGCVRILQNHGAQFKERYGIDVELARVCSLVPEQAAELGVSGIFTLDYHDVVNDPSIDIVIELIGGTTVAKSIVCEALENGKHVVTANKALMATSGNEILALAADKGLEVAYEASVGGGIPIIDPLTNNLIANDVSSVMGIVNGTTNYMLTRMAAEGLSYDEVLAQAQALGYAEANPTADVDGFDAAAKIAILSGIAFDADVRLDDVATEGIRAITPADLALAGKLGYCVKLLAIGRRAGEALDVRVHPTLLPTSHQLANVNGVYNAIYVTGDAVGETMFFGAGAGSGPAASAVMGDVLNVARRLAMGVAPVPLQAMSARLPFVDATQLESTCYARFNVGYDDEESLDVLVAFFAEQGASVRDIRVVDAGDGLAVAFLVSAYREAAIRAAVERAKVLDNVVCGEPLVIRVVE